MKRSARWRVGDRCVRFLEVLLLRRRPQLLIDAAAVRLADLRSWDREQVVPPAFREAGAEAPSRCLSEWMALLDEDFRALMRSKRWLVGNLAVRAVEISIGRRRTTLATDRMQRVFADAAQWRPSQDEHRDVQQFACWFGTLERELGKLLDSRRWQVGTLAVGSLDRLLLRGRRGLVVGHMRRVLARYHSWRAARGNILPGVPGPATETSRQARPGSARVDVIVPVFNALDDVERCLASVLRHTAGALGRLIVIDDGSERETAEWLRAFAATHPDVELIEHRENLGYTRAVNTGLRASTEGFVALLNSDTQVTEGWIPGLLDAMAAGPSVGIVGPLSNAATWQNVPDLYDETRHFAHNPLPPEIATDEMARVVAHASLGGCPRTPFLNGFCFMIRRAVLERIGLMDEASFPMGYGEENDYCIRAADAGFELRIADAVYVHHAQSRSFGHERRAKLSQEGFQTLERKHGRERFHGLVEQVKETSEMDRVRGRVRAALAGYIAGKSAAAARPALPQPERSWRHGPPAAEPAAVALDIIVYSDRPGPDLRLTLDALASSAGGDGRELHVIADWPAGEQAFRYDRVFPGRLHRFPGQAGLLGAVGRLIGERRPERVCVITAGNVVGAAALDALVAATLGEGGLDVAMPVTSAPPGLVQALPPGEDIGSMQGRLTDVHGAGPVVRAAAEGCDVFALSSRALACVMRDPCDAGVGEALAALLAAPDAQGLTSGVALRAYTLRLCAEAGRGPAARPALGVESAAAWVAAAERAPQTFARAASPSRTRAPAGGAHPSRVDTVCLIVSTLDLYGGVIVLVNWANQLILSGVHVRVYVLHYGGRPAEGLRVLFEPQAFTSADAVARELPPGVRVVASLWSTVEIAEELVRRVPQAQGYYFIQDYEPRFYRQSLAERGQRRAAEKSYHTTLTKVVTSRWIARQLPPPGRAAAQPGYYRIPVGIDHAIYPPSEPKAPGEAPVIVAMARPETPRRGFALLIAALERVKRRHPEAVVRLFGSADLGQQSIPFAFSDLGVLPGERLRRVYWEADLFLDTSDFQGFGLCPLEAMALGCGCVLTESGGVSEYAEDRRNALMVPHDAEAIADAATLLIRDPVLRRRLAAAAVNTARAFDCARTAREWLRLFSGEPVAAG